MKTKRDNAMTKFRKAMSAALAVMPLLALAIISLGCMQPMDMQNEVHAIAEHARSIGLPEDSPIIVECQRLWWEYAKDIDGCEESADEAPSYTDQDLNILAKLIWKEAGGCPWEHKCTVGCVVLNRVADERFPDSIYDVVAQPKQYSTSYLYGFDGIPAECYEAARAVLEGEYTIPENVVWQAEFPQGRGIWWASEVNTGWWYSITYFCY